MLLSVNGRKTLEKTQGAIKMDIPEKLATKEPQDKEKQNTNNVNKTQALLKKLEVYICLKFHLNNTLYLRFLTKQKHP
jgi:hypothetical protein